MPIDQLEKLVRHFKCPLPKSSIKQHETEWIGSRTAYETVRKAAGQRTKPYEKQQAKVQNCTKSVDAAENLRTGSRTLRRRSTAAKIAAFPGNLQPK